MSFSTPIISPSQCRHHGARIKHEFWRDTGVVRATTSFPLKTPYSIIHILTAHFPVSLLTLSAQFSSSDISISITWVFLTPLTYLWIPVLPLHLNDGIRWAQGAGWSVFTAWPSLVALASPAPGTVTETQGYPLQILPSAA